MKKLTKQYIKTILKPRSQDAHKGNFGHSLLIAGSTRKIGSAIISSKACLRSGVGLLTLNVPKQERLALQVSIPEAMIVFREELVKDFGMYDSLGIGPGIGLEEYEIKLVENILINAKCPLILDADALNIVSRNKQLLKMIPKGTILTPHVKEFDRMFGGHSSVKARLNTALTMANELSIVIVLKGHETLICAPNSIWVNTTGNVGLAKGGSGDALTGMITAFLAQGYTQIHGAQLGVYLHGLAADISIKYQSVESLLITDVINNIGQAFKIVGK